MATDVAWYRVGDPGWTTVQAAIDQAVLAGGGVVYLPPGQHVQSATVVVPSTPSADKPLILRGDGAGVSFLTGGTPGGFDILSIQRSGVAIEGLTVGPSSVAPSNARGIVVGGGATPVADVAIRDCIVRWSTTHALFVAARNLLVERSVFADNHGTGLVLVDRGSRNVAFRRCSFEFFRGTAVELRRCVAVSIAGGAIREAADLGTAPFVLATDADDCRLVGVHFEEGATATATQWFVDLGRGCNGWVVVGCHFLRRANVDGTLKLVRFGACDGDRAGSVLGGLLLSPFVQSDYEPTEPGDVTIDDSCSEVCVAGGIVEAGNPLPEPPDGRLTLDILDRTSKSTWIGPQRWRPPLVGASETPNSGNLGDLLARPTRGLEMWNARATEASWVPTTVNRYANEDALKEIPSTSKNRGTLVWIDVPAAGASNLRVWDGSAWRGVIYA